MADDGPQPDPEDVRGGANGVETLAAIKLALASRPLAGDRQVLGLIDWMMEGVDPEPSRGAYPTKLFIEAIRETRA